jgi:hypothetical protein
MADREKIQVADVARQSAREDFGTAYYEAPAIQSVKKPTGLSDSSSFGSVRSSDVSELL